MNVAHTDPAHFERMYRAERDPWGYETAAYERDKYARTLVAAGPGPIASALELGCSIGVFTALLAPRCGALLAVDGAPSALVRARARLRGVAHVRLARRTLPQQLPRGPFDLIVASELLYYWSEATLRAALPRIEAALRPGGRCVAVHWRGELRDGPLDGDRVHELLLAHARQPRSGLRHVETGSTTAYRLDAFVRSSVAEVAA